MLKALWETAGCLALGVMLGSLVYAVLWMMIES